MLGLLALLLLAFRADLVLPLHTQDLSATQLPTLCGLSSSPERGMIAGIVPPVVPAARTTSQTSLALRSWCRFTFDG